jgi:biopolymer transport protein ExbD
MSQNSEGHEENPNIISRLEGKKAIRSYARKLEEPEVIKDLNITPMMDMMTIILVFLLKSFSSSASTITFDSNLQVPKSSTQLKMKLALAITVTKKVILVEGDAIAPINLGRVDPTVKRDGENGYYITPLVEILEKHAKREKKVAELTGQKFDAQLMIIADQTTPYRLLTEIFYSCGQAGYANYRLIVLKSKGD